MKSIFRVDEVAASKLEEVLKSIMNTKQAKENFNTPVDWRKHKLTTYLQVIQKPMDLGYVLRVLKDDSRLPFEKKQYQCTQEFAHDVRLVCCLHKHLPCLAQAINVASELTPVAMQVFKNCFLFNALTHHVFKAGKELAKRFEGKLAAVERDIERSGPPCSLRLRCQLLLTDMRRNPMSEWFRRDDWKLLGDDYINIVRRFATCTLLHSSRPFAHPPLTLIFPVTSAGSYPIDLNMMQERFTDGHYTMATGEFNVDAFAADGQRIFQNAIAFNTENSWIGVIVSLLADVFSRRLKDLRDAPVPPVRPEPAPDRDAHPNLKRKRSFYERCLLLSSHDANRLVREVEDMCKSAVTHTANPSVTTLDIEELTDAAFEAAEKRLPAQP